MVPGGRGNLTVMRPNSRALHSVPSALRTVTGSNINDGKMQGYVKRGIFNTKKIILPSYPGKGIPAEYLGGFVLCSKPMQDAVMACPVSVCHQ